MDEVVITPMADGPDIVRGPARLVDADFEPAERAAAATRDPAAWFKR